MRTIQDVVNEIEAELFPLPEGYFVEANNDGGVIIYSKYPEPEGLGFVITARTIEEGDHVAKAVDGLADLIPAVDAAVKAKGRE